MLRLRTILIAICSAALLASSVPPAGAATLNLDGFKLTFPRADALCVKADRNKLGKKLKPSRAKVLAACKTLRESYSRTHTAFLAAVEPLRVQMREIVRQQREACLQAKRSRDRTGCRQAGVDARAKLAPLRAQIATQQRTARQAYDSARKRFWTAIRKLRGGKDLKQDAAPGETPVADVPSDTELDQS